MSSSGMPPPRAKQSPKEVTRQETVVSTASEKRDVTPTHAQLAERAAKWTAKANSVMAAGAKQQATESSSSDEESVFSARTGARHATVTTTTITSSSLSSRSVARVGDAAVAGKAKPLSPKSTSVSSKSGVHAPAREAKVDADADVATPALSVRSQKTLEGVFSDYSSRSGPVRAVHVETSAHQASSTTAHHLSELFGRYSGAYVVCWGC